MLIVLLIIKLIYLTVGQHLFELGTSHIRGRPSYEGFGFSKNGICCGVPLGPLLFLTDTDTISNSLYLHTPLLLDGSAPNHAPLFFYHQSKVDQHAIGIRGKRFKIILRT